VELLPLTMNPNVALAEGARRPFQASLTTLIVDPLAVGRPPHS
jgi:hypothetical protein